MSTVNFTINGKEFSVNPAHGKFGPNSLLVDYIRDESSFKGTKWMCREGGCGACVVTCKSRNEQTGEVTLRSINSCLTPVLMCDGWEIQTVEGIGNQNIGYHKIQESLVKHGATQCGYCSPGFVMNMYGLAGSAKGPLTPKDIEEAFDGNICRCTGYRPIMDAFKSLASSENRAELSKIPEALTNGGCCMSRNGVNGDGYCKNGQNEDIKKVEVKVGLKHCFTKDKKVLDNKIHIKTAAGEEWIKPQGMEMLLENLGRLKSAKTPFRFVGGNTGFGVYRSILKSQTYIDLAGVPELHRKEMSSDGLTLGGGVTLSEMIKYLNEAAQKQPDGFNYAVQMANHVKRIANTPVRNAASIAGNLMLKYHHNDFPSDVFTLLEAVGAKIEILASPNLKTWVTPTELLKIDMDYKVVSKVTLPPLSESEGHYFRSFKITRRYQNAHAYVNAAFVVKVDMKNNFKVMSKPSLVYGGIRPTFVRALNTENYLFGKSLKDPATISGAMESLDKEVNPDVQVLEAAPIYRKTLASSLLYKVFLGILNNSVGSKVKSGATDIERKEMMGKQTWDKNESKANWPIGEPISKLEGIAQASGEAQYAIDVPKLSNELVGALVLSTRGPAILEAIDPSEALNVPGVVSFIGAKDIPGKNNFAIPILGPIEDEEVFVSIGGKIHYHGAVLGMILAENAEAAYKAIGKVKVTYGGSYVKPNFEMKETLNRVPFESKLNGGAGGKHKIKGDFKIGHQFHAYMEPQNCLVIPKEDGVLDIYGATQFVKHTQNAVAQTLGIPQHNINISVKRIGGGYGGRATRSCHMFAAAAVGAKSSNQPVRLALDLETCMKIMGKRYPYYMTYDVEFDDKGKITSAKIKLNCNPGHNANESMVFYAVMFLQNCYNHDGWIPETANSLTDTANNTFCRSPGSTETIALVEMIMEHIAHTLKKDPLEVRAANYIKDGDKSYIAVPEVKFSGGNPIPKMIEQIQQTGDYKARREAANKFNAENRWKKRGMSLVPMRYAVHYMFVNYPVYIAVFEEDGTVAITHGGVEMGQGINTKVIQVVAKKFGIPVSKVKCKDTNNFTGVNSMGSGGSVTSELAAYNAIKACDIILENIAPVREKLGKDATWEEIISASHKEGIILSSVSQASPKDGLVPYDVWAVNLIEVEIDVLTGENKVVRCDLLEDVGYSLNPDVDIGQIEGSLIMALGYWTMEKFVFDPKSGELLTNNTWNYKVPLPRDIPEDLRVSMLANAPNQFGVLKSKAVGEPPFCLGVSVLFAIRDAINSARKDAGAPNEFIQLDAPCTPEDIVRLCMTSKSQFVV